MRWRRSTRPVHFAITLPRSTEAFVRGRVKFRIGRIVYLAFSRDGTLMGFAFPKEWREALVESEPETFMLPRQSDLRYNWAVVRLGGDRRRAEMRELVLDAWQMVRPAEGRGRVRTLSRRRLTAAGSVPELREPALEEAPLGVRVHELERALVGGAGLVGALEPAQQLGAGRVQVVVAVELEPLDERERRLDVARPRRSRRPGSARPPASR